MPGRRSGASASRSCMLSWLRTGSSPVLSRVCAWAPATAPSNSSWCSRKGRRPCLRWTGATALTPGRTSAWVTKPDRARQVAVDALVRVDEEDAFANLLLPGMLDRSKLPARDRALVTELVYGTLRMRRACDWLIDRFVERDLDRPTRNLLRMGAYQLQFMGTPAYAVVSTSVELGGRARRLVEAVLRRVAESEP